MWPLQPCSTLGWALSPGAAPHWNRTQPLRSISFSASPALHAFSSPLEHPSRPCLFLTEVLQYA